MNRTFKASFALFVVACAVYMACQSCDSMTPKETVFAAEQILKIARLYMDAGVTEQ